MSHSIPLLRILTAVLILCGLPLTASGAAQTKFAAVGGRGDAEEEVICPTGHVLSGFSGRTGVWIDQIRLICSEVLPNFALGKTTRLPIKGGSGGSPTESNCDPGGGIRSIQFFYLYDERRVRILQFSCSKPRDGANAGQNRQFGGADYSFSVLRPTIGPFNRVVDQACPGAEYATGLIVRYGRDVNAVGLICNKVVSTTPPPVLVLPGMVARPAPAPPGSGTSDPARPIRRLGRTPATGTNQTADACLPGFVWRNAGPDDRVCVLSYSRTRAVRDNQLADSRRDPDGASGPSSCIAGYVWREAFPGDAVCVTPAVRSDTARENALADQRRVQR